MIRKLGIFLLLVCFAGAALAETHAERRAEINKRRADTLAKLYKVHPAARGRIAGAYGYAVFTNLGINLVLIAAAGGNGVAHDNKTGHDTYMKMVSGGVGLGLGVKDFRGIFVFTTQKAFHTFVDEGWEAGVQADAVAKAGKEGGGIEGAISVAPGTYLYQLTENGLALEATIQGTKYFKDDDLNAGK
ncbi:MAG TPA: YSC84-related protein [Stellaceae bacterium]|nr:YSC84-related protein [Stellaceae bacterium]